MSHQKYRTLILVSCSVVSSIGAVLSAKCSYAETEHVVITGLGVLDPDWDSGINFGLYSPTESGADTVTITNIAITGADFTFADGNGDLVNESPTALGDVTANLTTTSGTGTFTAGSFPEAATVTNLNSITLQDAFGDGLKESNLFNTFWAWQSISTMSFDVTIDSTSTDFSDPDLFYVSLTNCGWPPLLLPTNSPTGQNTSNDLIYVPITSSDPAFQFYTTQPGAGDTSDLPTDTNYPGITANAEPVPEPSPLVALLVGVLCTAALALKTRSKRRSS